jgi:hypothetical protein
VRGGIVKSLPFSLPHSLVRGLAGDGEEVPVPPTLSFIITEDALFDIATEASDQLITET